MGQTWGFALFRATQSFRRSRSCAARLQLQLYSDRLDLGVILQRVFTELAPDTRLFVAAKRSGGIEDVEAIDPHRARSNGVRHGVRLRDVASPHGGRQTVERFVRAVNNFVEVLEAQDGHHGPENFLLGNLHAVLDVAENRRLDEISFGADAVAAREEFGLVLLARFDIAHHYIELIAVHLRSLFGVLVERISNRARLRASDALCDEFVVALILDEQPRPGAAALPLVEEERLMRAFDGLVHIRISENDVGTFATELERDAFEVRRPRRLHDQASHLGGTGERNFVHVHVARDRRTRRGTVAGQQVHDSRREARFEKQFAYSQSCQGCLLGGFHHHRATGGKRGTELPCLHQQWEIPWNDLPYNADGFMARVTEEISVDGNCLALNFVRPARVVTVASNRERQVGDARDKVGLSIVKRLKLRQFVGVLFDQIREAVQELGSLGTGCFVPRPGLERNAGCVNSLVHIRRVGFGHLADFLAGGGIDGGERLSGYTVYPLIVDQKLFRSHRNAGLNRASCSCHKPSFSIGTL